MLRDVPALVGLGMSEGGLRPLSESEGSDGHFP